MREPHQLWLRRIAAGVSIAAFAAWGWLGLKAMTGPETHTMGGWRTLAFAAAIIAGTVAWPLKPRKEEDDESF
jgi:hypothetical protein